MIDPITNERRLLKDVVKPAETHVLVIERVNQDMLQVFDGPSVQPSAKKPEQKPTSQQGSTWTPQESWTSDNAWQNTESWSSDGS